MVCPISIGPPLLPIHPHVLFLLEEDIVKIPLAPSNRVSPDWMVTVLALVGYRSLGKRNPLGVEETRPRMRPQGGVPDD